MINKTDARVRSLPDHVVTAIKARRRFDSGWLIGRITPGNTYILSSHPAMTDSGKPRDLIAILPGDLGHGRVLQLHIATNSNFMAEVEAIVNGGD